jgi:hypothetical protein
VSSEYFINISLTSALTKMSARNISWEVKADNLTIFICQMFWNLVTSTSWNPQGLKQACTDNVSPIWTENFQEEWH